MSRHLSIVSLVIALFGGANLHAQIRVGVQATSGIGAGWWVYNRGFTEDGFHQGYDRTHLAFSIPLEGEILLEWNRWEFTLGGGTRRLVDDVMVASDDRRGSRNVYTVSEEEFLRMRHLHLGLAYQLIRNRRYRLSPTLRLGSFWFEHIHPAKARMGAPFMMDVGITQAFQLSNRWDFLLEGRYSDWRVWGNDEALRGEDHHIYTIDLRLGLRCWMYAK